MKKKIFSYIAMFAIVLTATVATANAASTTTYTGEVVKTGSCYSQTFPNQYKINGFTFCSAYDNLNRRQGSIEYEPSTNKIVGGTIYYAPLSKGGQATASTPTITSSNYTNCGIAKTRDESTRKSGDLKYLAQVNGIPISSNVQDLVGKHICTKNQINNNCALTNGCGGIWRYGN